MTAESKNVQTTPTRTHCKRRRPLPYSSKLVGRPGSGSLPSTIAPPDQPLDKMDLVAPSLSVSWPRGYKTFRTLDSAEHEILNAHNYETIKKFSIFPAQISI